MSLSILELFRLLRSVIYLPYIFLYLACDEKNELNEDIIAQTIRLKSIHKIPILVKFLYLLVADSFFHELVKYRCRNTKIRHLFIFKDKGFYIPYDTKIAGGITWNHPFSTILNAKRIGRGVHVKNNITIGNKNDDENMRPTIGDNVYIGAGAIIIGNIVIGNNVIIGAGAVVVKNVPDESIIVGNPSYVIKTINA